MSKKSSAVVSFLERGLPDSAGVTPGALQPLRRCCSGRVIPTPSSARTPRLWPQHCVPRQRELLPRLPVALAIQLVSIGSNIGQSSTLVSLPGRPVLGAERAALLGAGAAEKFAAAAAAHRWSCGRLLLCGPRGVVDVVGRTLRSDLLRSSPSASAWTLPGTYRHYHPLALPHVLDSPARHDR